MDLSPMYNQLRQMVNDTLALIPNLLVGLVVFLLFLFAGRGLRNFVQRLSRERWRHRNLGLVLSRLAYSATFVIGALVALTIIFPSFSPANLVSALGFGSIIVSFAFRDIAQNFLAGILILLNEPFRINDQIIYDRFEGTVEEIQIRATTLRTYDGRRVVIPNAELFTNVVTVNTAFEQRRMQYDIGISYDNDISQARALILEALRGVEGVLDDPPPDALVIDLAPSTVNLRARWWVRPPFRADVMSIQDQVLQTIKEHLLANAIELPFPTQQVLFHDQTAVGDAGRSQVRS